MAMYIGLHLKVCSFEMVLWHTANCSPQIESICKIRVTLNTAVPWPVMVMEYSESGEDIICVILLHMSTSYFYGIFHLFLATGIARVSLGPSLDFTGIVTCEEVECEGLGHVYSEICRRKDIILWSHRQSTINRHASWKGY